MMKKFLYSIYDALDKEVIYVLLASFYILIISIIDMLLHRMNIHVTRRLVFLLVSCFHGLLSLKFPQYLKVQALTPTTVALLLLPVSLHHTIFNTDLIYLKKYTFEIIVTTFIGIITFTITNLSMLFNFTNVPFAWRYETIYILAMSGIDSIENIEVYKEFERLRVGLAVLEGEFILGTCFGYTTLAVYNRLVSYNITSWTVAFNLIMTDILASLATGLLTGAVLSFLIIRKYGNIYILTYGVLIVMFSSFFICVKYFYMSGLISIIIISFILKLKRPYLSIDVDEALEKNWKLIYYLFEYIAYYTLIPECIYFVNEHIGEIVYFKHISVFFMGEMSRILLLAIHYPLTAYTAKYNLGDFFVQFWFAKRGMPQLILTTLVFNDYSDREKADWISTTLFYIAIHHVLYNILCKALLKAFHLSRHPNEKKENFFKCIQEIQKKKELFLYQLKMNRYFSDCKWILAGSYTRFTNYDFSHKHESFTMWRERKSICNNCNKNVTLAPSVRELNQMILEAKFFALSAQRMSAVQQYEKCLITKEVLSKIMLNLKVNKNNTTEEIDISDIITMFRKRGMIDKIRDNFVMHYKNDKIRYPQNKIRRFMYRVMLNAWYEVFIYLVVIVSVWNYYHETKSDLLYLEVIFFLIFLSDSLLKIYAHSDVNIWSGIKIYLSYPWNIFDVIILPINLIIIVYHTMTIEDELVDYIFVVFICQLTNLRIFKIIVVLYRFKLWIILQCNGVIGRKLALAYSVGLSMTICYREMLHVIPVLINNQDICKKLLHQVEKKMAKINDELLMVQNKMPYIALTVKTKQIIKVTMCKMKEYVKQLSESGMTDEYEEYYLIESINSISKAVMTLKNLKLSPPELIFYGQIWLEDVENITEIFYKSFIVTWEAGEVVMGKGTVSPGIYILIEGLLEQYYTPEESIYQHVKQYGMLPVYDCIMHSQFWKGSKSHIIPGNSFGFLSVVTGRPYESVTTSQTKSSAYFIPKSVIEERILTETSKTIFGLYNNIWKFISLEMVISIIWEKPQYRKLPNEALYFQMRKAHVPNLRDETFFVKSDVVDAIILIEGMVEEVNQNVVYIAPCYLPRTVNKLRMITTWAKPVLMIMYLKEMQYHGKH